MPLVAPHDILWRARAEHWAVGAFNTSNLEVTQAIVWALRDARAPGIIQTSEAAIQYAGLDTLRDIVRGVAASVDVPIVLHLDHGKSMEIARRCIDAGYGSVMIDGSALALAENIVLTTEVVTLAHAKGVWVEGEVGAIPGKEGMTRAVGRRHPPARIEDSRGDLGQEAVGNDFLTDPDEARTFARETGVDALAISVGQSHGAFRGIEKVQFERLKAIHAAVDVPLVLHGGSGLPDDEVRRSLSFGIVKVNIDTELREAFHDTVAGHAENAPEHSIDPRTILAPARDAVQRVVSQKVALLGSAGKAST